MKFLTGAYWDCGQQLCNQDSITIQQVMTSRGRVLMAIVCDGIGGLWKGEVASGYVIERMVACFYRQIVDLIGKGRRASFMEKSIMRCLYSINEEFCRYRKGKEEQLGTTMSLLLIWGHRYLICHIGDSRIYRCRKKRMELLTTDHSGGGHRLLKCMGSFPFQKPDIRRGRVRKKQGFLLCTDGFYNKQCWGEMFEPASIVEEEQIERRLQENAAYVKQQGEKDNLAAIYIRTR